MTFFDDVTAAHRASLAINGELLYAVHTAHRKVLAAWAPVLSNDLADLHDDLDIEIPEQPFLDLLDAVSQPFIDLTATVVELLEQVRPVPATDDLED